MSDDLKADIVALLEETVIPGDRRSAKAWRARCEMIADRVLDRCMAGAMQMGFDAREEIERLESELKAAKLLVDPKAIDAMKLLTDDNVRLTQENEGLRGGNMWVSAVMASVVNAVNKRDLDEVVRICKVYEMRMDEAEGVGESVH